MRIGIVGNGFVGRATGLYKCPGIDVVTYDKDPAFCDPPGTVQDDLAGCDVVFVCVPTPSDRDGNCYLGIVESVVRDLKALRLQTQEKKGRPPFHIVVKSTVPPGTCERLGVNHMPEFLTERNWERDFRTCKTWVVGTVDENDESFKITLRALTQVAKGEGAIESDDVVFVPTRVSELVKYVRNTFLAVKVSFFNEIEEYCRHADIPYELVRDLATRDTRIGSSHTAVPGPDGQRGFGGTCFPKDLGALLEAMETVDVPSYVLRAAQDRNANHDRSNHDWEANVGRSII